MVKDIINSYLHQIEAMKNLARKKEIIPKSLDIILCLGVKTDKEVPTNYFLNEIIAKSDSFEYQKLVYDGLLMLKVCGYIIKDFDCTLQEKNVGKKCLRLTKSGRALYKEAVKALEATLKA